MNICVEPDLTSYNAKPANVDINARNNATTAAAKLSGTFNFSKPDAAPDLELNEVIWQSVKGAYSLMPAPRHSAFVKVIEKDD